MLEVASPQIRLAMSECHLASPVQLFELLQMDGLHQYALQHHSQHPVLLRSLKTHPLDSSPAQDPETQEHDW